MARIYQVREKLADGKSTGRFDYTVSSDDEGWAHALGYCGPSGNHPDGHPTREEAEDCWRSYCLDRDIRIAETTTAERCAGCHDWTPRLVEVGPFLHFYLCDRCGTVDLSAERALAEERWPSAVARAAKETAAAAEASAQVHHYGDAGTIHQTGVVNVEVDAQGKVVSVWFRCLGLPFTQHVVHERRAEEMRRMSESVNTRIAITAIDYREKEPR
jgi:hypothetical protein